MSVFFTLLFLNSMCEFLHSNFAIKFPVVGISSCRLAGAFPEVGISSSGLAGAFPEVGISSSRLAGAFPEVGISSSRLAGAFPEVGISSCRLAGAFPEVGITLCRLANIIPEVEITLCRLANIIPEVGMAFRRTGRSNLRAEEHANNRTKMEKDGKFSFNNDSEYNFLTINKDNGIGRLVLRNKNRRSDFYNNFITNQNFLSHGSNYKI